MKLVLVKNGTYRNAPVTDTEFKLIRGLQFGAKGSYITVRNEGHFPIAIDTIKIKVDGVEDIEVTDPDGADEEAAKEPVIPETDQEAMDRIAYRFRILEEMSLACIQGAIKSVIISGPPGVGKSHTIEQQMEKYSLLDVLSNSKVKFNVVKGSQTALGLYVQLYLCREKGNVLVFDDMDSAFTDEVSLNLLKAALDSSKRRKICWNSDSRLLKEEQIPNSFEFQGSVIFITNVKFQNIKSKKLQDHLAALESRCHYVDLTIDTDRDKILRIKQVHRDADGGLFADYKFANNEENEILDFMQENARKLREMSMRMAIKIADLVKISPTDWKRLAENTVMHRRPPINF